MSFSGLKALPQPRRFAVAGGGHSTDWREICPCQRHGGRSVGRRLAQRITRRRAVVLTMMATVGFAAIGIPTRAMMLPEESSFLRGSIAEVIDVARPRAPFAMRFRSRYIDPELLQQHSGILSERVKEEFFRTEIPYGAIIYAEAKRHALAPELIAAIVKTESDFRPHLRSHKNALGLMQIVPNTGRLVGAHDLLDPEENIRAGTRYLKYLERRFRGDQTMILAAYNAGEGNIARFGGIPPFRETQEYLQRVARNQQRYTQRIASRLAVNQATSLVLPGSSALIVDLVPAREATAQQ